MINLLVIDPHPIVRSGFKNFLSDFDHLNIDYITDNACDALSYIESNPIDIIISEMVLSDISPFTFINKSKKINPNINIVFFSHMDENIYSIPLLRGGAIGYLSKNVKAKVMADALSKIHTNNLYIINNFNNELSLDVDLDRPRNSFETLSAREIKVLKYLTDGKRNIEIAKRLDINQKTVNTYKNRMMQKLNVNNVFDLYLQAKNMNLV